MRFNGKWLVLDQPNDSYEQACISRPTQIVTMSRNIRGGKPTEKHVGLFDPKLRAGM